MIRNFARRFHVTNSRVVAAAVHNLTPERLYTLLNTCTCIRCNHTWRQRGHDAPDQCPRCQTPHWKTPPEPQKTIEEQIKTCPACGERMFLFSYDQHRDACRRKIRAGKALETSARRARLLSLATVAVRAGVYQRGAPGYITGPLGTLRVTKMTDEQAAAIAESIAESTTITESI